VTVWLVLRAVLAVTGAFALPGTWVILRVRAARRDAADAEVAAILRAWAADADSRPALSHGRVAGPSHAG